MIFRLCDDPDKAVVELQHKLHEKDMKMTDIQLEALSSAHQLEQLRDTMNRMKVRDNNLTTHQEVFMTIPLLKIYLRNSK